MHAEPQRIINAANQPTVPWLLHAIFTASFWTALCCIVVLSTSAFADDIDEGIAAYDRGEYATAISKFRKSAEQGHARAQYNLGLMYDEGQGVPEDDKQAIYWYTKSAEQGHAGAQYNLGLMYVNGEGVPKDYKQAVYWFTKAAEQGDAQAQLNLAVMYFKGEGVPKDYVTAYLWLNLAAAQGNERARTNLGKLEPMMTPEQIAEAQRLSREWKPR